MNGRIVKSKTDRRNKQRRKRNLKKKRKQVQSFPCSVKNPFLAKPNSVIDWKAVNMAANYWSQSRASMADWQHKHEIAYWKSKAEALSYENKILHSIIQNIYCSKSEQSHAGSSGKTQFKKHLPQSDEDEQVDNDMEVSEEFMSYLKTSMKHKMELEKSKQKENEKNCQAPKQPVDADRIKEMKMLYGKSSALIVGLETKVNLNYDQYRDKNKPDYWPYFPLNPSM